jgi:hypothetical protein
MRTAVAVALAWSVALLVAATVVPVYGTSTETASGTVTGSATLVDENGSGILLVVAVPLLMSVIVGCTLWSRGARRGAGMIAWTATVLLAGFNLIAMLSIGLFIVPVTVCLAIACALRQSGPRGESTV